METPREQLEPLAPVSSSTEITAKRKTSGFIKFIRIFLLVLIILGIGLLFTQNFWLPKLVSLILKPQVSLTTQIPTTAVINNPLSSGITNSASSTNPDFQTYTNTTLGFSIDIPKTAASEGCDYNSVRGSYEPVEGTSSTPIVTVVQGNTVYIGFAYFYDLIQDTNNPANYSSCVKNDISTYLPLYISQPLATSTFSDVEPISITILNATSTESAKDTLLQYYNAYEYKNFASEYIPPFDTSGKYACHDVTVTPTSDPQVYSMIPCGDDNYQIEYSASAKKIAFIIGTIDGQSCGFTHDFTPNSECYLSEIGDSFHFLK